MQNQFVPLQHSQSLCASVRRSDDLEQNFLWALLGESYCSLHQSTFPFNLIQGVLHLDVGQLPMWEHPGQDPR